MDIVNSLGVLMGGSWASGVNLYLTTAGLGIAHRMELITLPGNMESLANPLVTAVYERGCASFDDSDGGTAVVLSIVRDGEEIDVRVSPRVLVP